MTLPEFRGPDGVWTMPVRPVPWIGLVLIVLAALMLLEAIRILLSLGTPPRTRLGAAVPAPAA
jgi:hypothetical protein